MRAGRLALARNFRDGAAVTPGLKGGSVMSEAFHMGGWGMYPTLVFGLLMLAACVRYAISPELRFVPLQVCLGILTLMGGALGFVTGMIKTFISMSEVKPDDRWFWMLGVGESLNCLGLALTLMVLAALASSVGALRIARMKPANPEPAAA
jgi:hypothetical protein